jgi:hypothetical protein
VLGASISEDDSTSVAASFPLDLQFESSAGS